MSASELLKSLYTKLYNQRELLSEAPALTQDPNNATFDLSKVEQETVGVISYLMGVPDVRKVEFDKAIEIIQTHYASQPEWKSLLLDYLEYDTEKQKEILKAQEANLIKEIEEFTQKLLDEDPEKNG